MIAILSLVLIAVVGVFVAYERTELPDPNRDFQTNTSFIYYRDGSRLGSFSVQNRQSIPYETMPKTLRDAVVSAENRTFWSDPGISVKGMTRAAWAIARGGEMQGGSTITQQYIKVLYLSQERTMGRKFKELLLAVKTGKEVSKRAFSLDISIPSTLAGELMVFRLPLGLSSTPMLRSSPCLSRRCWLRCLTARQISIPAVA